MLKHTEIDSIEKAAELTKEMEEDEKTKRKFVLEHIASIASIIVVGLTIILYSYNTGYSKIYCIPTNAIPLSLENYIPICVQVLGIALYIIYYIAEIKRENILKKNRINFARLIFGAYITIFFFEKYNIDKSIGPWFALICSFCIPLVLEISFFIKRKPKKNVRYGRSAFRIRTENIIRDRIVYTYLKKTGLWMIILATLIAPFWGELSAKAKLDYQVCLYKNQLYAVIVDYKDSCLVQKAAIVDEKLTIYTDSYQYIKKEELCFNYFTFKQVDTQHENTIVEPIPIDKDTDIINDLGKEDIVDEKGFSFNLPTEWQI